MRLATITNWAYGATVLLTLVSGSTMLLASSAHEQERAAVAQRHVLQLAATELRRELFYLTDHARQFVMTGDPTYRILYKHGEKALASLETRARPLAEAGATPAELGTVREAIRWADALRDAQRAAFAAHDRGDIPAARAILFGAEHERELDRAQSLVERFQAQLDTRTAYEIEAATRVARLWRAVSEVMIGITALLFLAVLYFIFKRRVLRPVVRLSDVVGRLAAQDFSAVPPQIDQIDEIGDMAQAINIFRENGLERQRLEAERDRDLAVRDLLARMTRRMQGCDTLACLLDITRRFAPEIAPRLAGRLYLLESNSGELRTGCDWLAPAWSRDRFPPSACWALRRGQPHRPAGHAIDVPCAHLDAAPDATPDTLCLPLTAHGEILGLLYFEPRTDGGGEGAPAPESYLYMLAENIGLALANLRLRERLRALAMVDALTGLANRRQLEERLEQLRSDPDAAKQPVSCLMIDVDHFKRFNDCHGHDAGDAVLRAVGETLADCTRGAGDAYRYGGEEFTVLLPMPVARAMERAAEIRRRIAALRLSHGGVALGSITASIGIAATPDHCPPGRLIVTADAALLRAKEQGRDRIEVALGREAEG